MMLDTVENKSETVEEAVKYYLLNKDKPKKQEPQDVINMELEL